MTALAILTLASWAILVALTIIDLRYDDRPEWLATIQGGAMAAVLGLSVSLAITALA